MTAAPLPGLKMTARGNMVSVGWEAADGSARFHVWLAIKDGEVVRPFAVRRERKPGRAVESAVLYVNPPVGVSYARYDRATHTTYRDADAKANAATVERALRDAEAGGMLEAARQAAIDEEEEREANERAEFAGKIRAALQAHADRVLADSASEHADTLQALVADADDDELCALGYALRCA